VEAFRATLEEATLSDFLIHLLDASQPEVLEFYNTTMKVLAELGADERQMLVVFNKIDRVEDPATLATLRRHFPSAVFISVRTGEGLDKLVEAIAEQVANGSVTRELRLPQSEAGTIARLHRHAKVLETEYLGDEVRLVATMPARLAADLAEWWVESAGEKGTRLADSFGTKSQAVANNPPLSD
jgi:GTP-binding protein HflX